MWLEPPPKPSQNTEQALVELANYYRQLVVYHQRSAAYAASQLAQVETLLNPSLANNSVWQSPHLNNSVSNRAELVAELETTQRSLPERQLPTPEELIKSLQSILAANRAKILRLDYLVLEIAESNFLSPSQYPELKQQLKKTLEQGERQGLWASIPDSPGCWTLELKDFPDLVPQSLAKSKLAKKTNKKSSRAAYNRSRLPHAGKMKEYETLTAAISQCLREHAPRTMDAHQVMDWIYPDGLSEKVRNKAYQAISDGLNKGCSRKHWERAEIGWYYWRQ